MSAPHTISDAELGESVEQSARWVRDQVRTRKLAHTRVGRKVRFTEQQAEAFIAEFAVAAKDAAPMKDPLRTQSPRSRARTR